MMDIYFLFVEDFENCDLNNYENYLSAEEKELRMKFIFQKDKDQYLLTRVLVRKILSKKFNVDFGALNFGKSSYGKPYLIDYEDKVAFSISHSSGLIVLAVADNAKDIGIDVEKWDRDINLDIRSTVFTEPETLDYSRLSENNQKEYFFDIWTLKESYMKAIGKGFSLSPKSFSFMLGNNECKFIENPLESEPEYFGFQLFTIKSLYTLAVCHKRNFNKINSFRIHPYWEISSFNIDLKLTV